MQESNSPVEGVDAPAIEVAPPAEPRAGGDDDSNISSAEAGEECWICRDSSRTPDNPIVHNVCRCSGSVGAVHQECIDHWVFSSGTYQCNSCGVTYTVVSKDYPEGVQYPVTLWHQFHTLAMFLVIPLVTQFCIMVLRIVLQHVLPVIIIGVCLFPTDVSTWRLAGLDGVAERYIASNGPLPSWFLAPARWWFMANGLVFGSVLLIWLHMIQSGWKGWCDVFTEVAVEANGLGNDVGNPLANMDNGVAGEAEGGRPESTEESAYNEVQRMFNLLAYCRSLCKVDGPITEAIVTVAAQVAVCVPVALLLPTPTGMVTAVVTVLIGGVMWRLLRPSKVLRDSRRRFAEVWERRGECSHLDIVLWYLIYVVEMAFFSFMVPVAAGLVVHYSAAPFLISRPASVSALCSSLCPLQLLFYWAVGVCCSMVLMQIETRIAVTLFAPGVDLFYMRATDLQVEIDHIYWRCIYTHMFDSDMIRIIYNAVRLLTVELLALYCFLAIPIWATFALREWVWGDLLSGRLALPLARNIPLRPPVSANNLTTSQWLALQVTNAAATTTITTTSEYVTAGPMTTMLSGLLKATAAGQVCVTAASLVPWLYSSSGGGDSGLLSRHYAHHSNTTAPARPDASTSTRELILADIGEPFANETVPEERTSDSGFSGCFSFYMALLHVKVPFVRRAVSMLVRLYVSHPEVFKVIGDAQLIISAIGILYCFAYFPIQRMQLRCMKPLAIFLGRHVARMEGFLFDEERLRYVDDFVADPAIDELVMQPMVVDLLFVRREFIIPQEQVPSYLYLRLFVFSLVLLLSSCVLVWALPVVFMALTLSVAPYGLYMWIWGVSMTFMVWDFKEYCKSLAVGAMMVVVLACYVLIAAVAMATELVSLFVSRKDLVRAAFEYHYHIERTVGPYTGPEDSDWEDITEEDGEQQGEADVGYATTEYPAVEGLSGLPAATA